LSCFGQSPALLLCGHPQRRSLGKGRKGEEMVRNREERQEPMARREANHTARPRTKSSRGSTQEAETQRVESGEKKKKKRRREREREDPFFARVLLETAKDFKQWRCYYATQ
jgi:hypothetical protein